MKRCSSVEGSTTSRRKTDPLRTLAEEELESLGRAARSATAPAAEVARAESVRAGLDCQKAAAAAGRLGGDAVSHLVARSNRRGLQALRPRHGGGPAPTHSSDRRERVLREARREPTPELDGLPRVSTGTANRTRKSDTVATADPDTGAEKN